MKTNKMFFAVKQLNKIVWPLYKYFANQFQF